MRRLLVVLALALALTCAHVHYGMPSARGGPGGSLAMPGPCDYPFIGHQTYAAGAGWWYCDGPVEENCAHYHSEGKVFNAGGPTGSGVYGLELMGFGFTLPGGVIGGGDGFQGYVYQDLTMAPWPNPPGKWKDRLTPRCSAEHNHPPVVVSPDSQVPSAPAQPNLVPDDTNPVAPNQDSLAPTGS